MNNKISKMIFNSSSAHKLSSILWTVLLMQYVIWFSEIWHTETTRIVTITLIGMMIAEILLPRRAVIKMIVHMLVVLAANTYVLDYQLILFSLERFTDFLLLLDVNSSQILPYFWFNLPAALFFLFVLYWSVTRARTIFIVFVSVVALCIVDSFTFMELWQQIALIILSGLILIVIQHFKGFKQKHPDSWDYIKEYPASVLAPIVILITIMMLAGNLAPNVKPLVMDPYTAWQTYKGEPTFKFGKGYDLSDSEKGLDLPELSSSSGYSRNDTDLGGGFKFDYSEVMAVTTEHRSYWRGETRSYYTGEGWEMLPEEIEGSGTYVEPQTSLSEDSTWDTSKLETVRNNHSVTIYSDEVYPVLFGSYHIEDYNITQDIQGLESRIRWAEKNEELRWNSAGDVYPKRYTLNSEIPVIDPDGLREAYPEQPMEEFEFPDQYVQLPENLPQRVSDLVDEIVFAQESNYDRVKAIERFLSMEFPYTNEPDLSKVDSDDFVDGFLFELQEGYCDYYSTAMVVMVRSLGIPARWVKGYTPGQLPQQQLDDMYFEEEMGLEQDLSGTYTVRNADAHSWVEVYFPGYGWIPFEPTAGFSLPNQAPDPELDDFEFDPMIPEGSEGTDGGGQASWTTVILWSAVSAALILLGISLFLKFKLHHRFKMFSLSRMKVSSLNHKVIKEYDKFLRFAQRKGYTRKNNETVREWTNYWGTKDRFLNVELVGLMQIFEQAKYSPSPIQPEQAQQAIEYISKLRVKIRG